MGAVSHINDVSLVQANFGNGVAFEAILADWCRFLGGKPGEVLIVDGGSDRATLEVYWRLLHEAKIDKLQVIRPDHPQNHKDLCFIQEYNAGVLASKPYILFFKIDTLPYRLGHDKWLAEAIEHLDRPDVFAVGGSFNVNSLHHSAWPGWYFSHKCSENFALMKRDVFVAAMEEFAGDYIRGGFQGQNPAGATDQARYLVEVAFERYIEHHQKYTLVRDEDTSWTIAHTNLKDEELMRARGEFLARKGIGSYIERQRAAIAPHSVYYGMPPLSLLRRLRVRFGRTWAGPVWRTLKGRIQRTGAA